MATKYVFFTGGVVSGLGKGISASSLAALMEAHGYTATMLKIDPYVNVDPGTMSPFQHGEVFVTDDGAETDLDLGHYERFTSASMGKKNNFTTGTLRSSRLQRRRPPQRWRFARRRWRQSRGRPSSPRMPAARRVRSWDRRPTPPSASPGNAWKPSAPELRQQRSNRFYSSCVSILFPGPIEVKKSPLNSYSRLLEIHN